jgi:hypothetical protein
MTSMVAGTDAATIGEPADATTAVPALACRDCGTAYGNGANFCPHCGQETRVQLPHVFDFLREAADETIGISGRLPRTLGLLLFRPGRLTTEYIAGHRQRYVRPMRLYLSVSLVFFAVLGIATSDIGWIRVPSFGNSSIQDDLKDPHDEPAAGARTAKTDAGSDAKASPTSDHGVVDLTDLGRSKRPLADSELATKRFEAATERAAPEQAAQDAAAAQKPSKSGLFSKIPWLDHRLEKYKEMSRDQLVRTVTQGVQANAPYAVFILMPLAAFWYQLFYVFRRRRYAEHLLHAVHLHCFAFCIGTIALLPWVDGWRGWLFLLLGVYAILAERRVYGSGVIRATLGTFIGSLLYLIGVSFTATALAILSLAL